MATDAIACDQRARRRRGERGKQVALPRQGEERGGPYDTGAQRHLSEKEDAIKLVEVRSL
jgi:hypothetical protein